MKYGREVRFLRRLGQGLALKIVQIQRYTAKRILALKAFPRA